MKNKIDRTIIPEIGKPKDIHFPEYQKIILSPGKNLFIITNRRFPIVTFRIIFKSGAIYDRFNDDRNDGTSHFMMDMLSRGTMGKSADEISLLIDSYGASFSSGSDYDFNYITFHCLKQYFPKMMELFFEMLYEPVFPDVEIERMRLQKINSIYSMMDSGEYLASRLFKKEIYGKSQYAVNIEGTLETLPEIQRDRIIYAYQNYLLKSDFSLCFIGDVDIEDVNKIIEGKILLNENEKNDGIKIVEMPEIAHTKVYIVERKSSVQSDIIIGNKAIKRNHPDYIVMKVLNTILGGYFSSRINTNLREVNGYTYGARSILNCKKFQGDFLVETNVKNNLTGEAIAEIIKEIRLIQNEPLSKEELQNVKNYITGSFPMQLETPNSIASKVLGLDLFDIDTQFYNTYISKINELTPESILKAAKKYLKPDNLVISICGNPEEIKSSLGKTLPDIEVIEQNNN